MSSSESTYQEFLHDLAKHESSDEEFEDEFEHLEGSIAEFPEVVTKQINKQDYTEFPRSRWTPKHGKQQCLSRSYNGRPTKFVLENDPTMRELAAGRFGSGSTDQVVVVGIPDNEAEKGVRYVIVARPPKCKDTFKRPIRGTKNGKGSPWFVWRPDSSNFNQYYKKAPPRIYRVEEPISSAGGTDTGNDSFPVKMREFANAHQVAKSPVGTANPSVELHAQDNAGRDQEISKQEATSPTMSSTTAKCKTPPETSFEQSTTPKKARPENSDHEKSTPATSGSGGLVSSSSHIGTEEPDFPNSPSVPHGQSILSVQEPVQQIAPEKSESSTDANTRKDEESTTLTLEGLEDELPLPPQKDAGRDKDDVTMTPISVKQEVVSKDYLILSRSPDTARETWPTIVHSIPRIQDPKPIPVHAQYPMAEKPREGKLALADKASRQSEPIGVVDLIDDHDQDTVQPTMNRQINVRFIDEHGQAQFVVDFDECNTAEGMFEEACAWDIADKETKMLEVTIPGCKPTRVRKNNEKHFAQKVFEPLKEIVARLGQGQSITLTVQKHM